MIRYVVLDLGQVLASPADLYSAPAKLLGVDPSALDERYWADRRAYDTGIDASGEGSIPGFLMSAPGPVGGADVATVMDVDAEAR